DSDDSGLLQISVADGKGRTGSTGGPFLKTRFSEEFDDAETETAPVDPRGHALLFRSQLQWVHRPADI
ncbi:MAG: hypothetical protein VX034_09210, partial [Planctomycetota bacterium]|nr:hypothetical protein [Planctomycetota bacterium]